MIEYTKFWLAHSMVDLALAVVVILIFIGLGLWSIRGQKSYKEPK